MKKLNIFLLHVIVMRMSNLLLEWRVQSSIEDFAHCRDVR